MFSFLYLNDFPNIPLPHFYVYQYKKTTDAEGHSVFCSVHLLREWSENNIHFENFQQIKRSNQKYITGKPKEINQYNS